MVNEVIHSISAVSNGKRPGRIAGQLTGVPPLFGGGNLRGDVMGDSNSRSSTMRGGRSSFEGALIGISAWLFEIL
jgi:hypothetical protein